MTDDSVLITGISTIDKQHAEIFSTMYRLRQHVPDWGIALSAIDNLIATLGVHFSYEMNFIRAADPQQQHTTRHEQAHQSIINRIVDIRRIVTDNQCVPHDAVEDLIRFMIEHVKQEDSLFVSWFNQYND